MRKEKKVNFSQPNLITKQTKEKTKKIIPLENRT